MILKRTENNAVERLIVVGDFLFMYVSFTDEVITDNLYWGFRKLFM